MQDFGKFKNYACRKGQGRKLSKRVLLLFLALGFATVLHSQAEAGALCAKVYRTDLTATSGLSGLYHEISSRVGELQAPTWNEYNYLDQLIRQLEAGSGLDSSSRERLVSRLSSEKLKLKKLYLQLQADSEKKIKFQKYLDYHLAFFRLLQKANRLMGEEIFAIPDLSWVATDRQLRTEAQNLISRLEKVADEVFPQTGHQNLQEFRQSSNQFSADLQRKIKLLDDDVEIAVHRPENARFWIPLTGFQNQRVTGSSKGTYFNDADSSQVSGRNLAEANLAFIPVNDYVPLSPRFKPNYGEVRPSQHVTDPKPSPNADGYGPDLWILKKEAVAHRSTWFPTDTLGEGRRSKGVPSFNSMFIPWKYRSLMAPFAVSETGIMEPSRKPQDFKWDLENKLVWNTGWGTYFEVQIWGPLSLEDVKALHFKKNPPSRELFELLKSKGIEVFDERQWPAKKYEGEESQ